MSFWIESSALLSVQGGGVAGAITGGIIGGVTIAPAMGKESHFMQAFLAELGKCPLDKL